MRSFLAYLLFLFASFITLLLRVWRFGRAVDIEMSLSCYQNVGNSNTALHQNSTAQAHIIKASSHTKKF